MLARPRSLSSGAGVSIQVDGIQYLASLHPAFGLECGFQRTTWGPCVKTLACAAPEMLLAVAQSNCVA